MPLFKIPKSKMIKSWPSNYHETHKIKRPKILLILENKWKVL